MPNRHFLRSDIFTFVIVYSFYFRLFSPNELNSYPLTFDWLLVIVRLLIRLTEVSGMNHMKYKTLIADRLGNSCLDIGFFYFTLTGSSRAVTHHLKEVGVFSTEINILSDIPEKK